jgi:hypothetical protein
MHVRPHVKIKMGWIEKGYTGMWKWFLFDLHASYENWMIMDACDEERGAMSWIRIAFEIMIWLHGRVSQARDVKMTANILLRIRFTWKEVEECHE